MMARRWWWLGGAALVFATLAAAVIALNLRDEDSVADDGPPGYEATAPQIERGRYLVRVGNCAACHTAQGGQPFAGGLGIATPFGTVFSSNLTPDAQTGIGSWSAAHFWRAMHNGRAKDGRLLYPAFPYPNYTQVTREDSDAIYAYLRSIAPVEQANRPHALRFPFNSQAALAVWRALYFKPGVYQPDPRHDVDWNRGSYLVRGLGHCSACHASRNALGAIEDAVRLGGGLIPIQNWYAPSLDSPREAGVADWDTAQVVALLKNGVSRRGSVMGPMAEVVYGSTQYLSDGDLTAIATYLQQLPPGGAAPPPPRRPIQRADSATLTRGDRLYAENCAQCHGKQGQGAAGAYPPLAGNRAVLLDNPANLVRVVVSGGYLPATAGNPRPYGMPPFGQTMNDQDIAALLSYIRSAWGNQAGAVTQLEVLRYR
jgi:mono/diheme cytochrome c family protein